MRPHPDLRYKRTEVALMCELAGRIIAFAFAMDDGRWELTPIDEDRTVHPDRAAVLQALFECTRRYAWAHTTLH